MIEFLQSYWSYISFGLLVIAEIILFILKKRPQVIDNSFLTKLCQWILEAESKFKFGSDKMSYVLDCAKGYLGDKYSEKEIRSMVEYLLTIPEKKGR